MVIQSFPIYTRIYCVWLSYVHSYHLWYQYALSTTRSETRKSFRPNDLILSDHLIMIVQLKTGWWSISDLCIIRIYFIHTTLFVHWAGPLFKIYMLNENWRIINRRIFHKSFVQNTKIFYKTSCGLIFFVIFKNNFWNRPVYCSGRMKVIDENINSKFL